MRSEATSVAQYLKELPADRREAVSALRDVIVKNLHPDFEEGMTYGMIGYYVPHPIYPPGYHCDPRQPLPFAGLASQKQYISFYFMSLYDPNSEQWVERNWAAAGLKLDKGKCCLRFRKPDQIPLEMIGKLISRMTPAAWIAAYERSRTDGTFSRSKSSRPATTRKSRSVKASPRAKAAAETKTKRSNISAAKPTAKKETLATDTESRTQKKTVARPRTSVPSSTPSSKKQRPQVSSKPTPKASPNKSGQALSRAKAAGKAPKRRTRSGG